MSSFSIYLFKPEFNGENCFKEDADLGEIVDSPALPDGASLHVFDNPPKQPWWRSYFEIPKSLPQTLKGAILILPVDDRTFCLTFGQVAHKLLDASFEYDFGIQVTLNCLDPKKIKNTDTLMPASSMRQRTQVSSDTELANFDFDRNSTIVKSLTGKVRDEYKDLIKSATGAAHLRISTDVVAEELSEICEQLLGLYQSEDYKEHFAELRSIVPIHDPLVVDRLNANLLEAVRDNDGVGIMIPEVVDYQDAVSIRFKGARGRYICEDIQLSKYQEYLQQQDVDVGQIDVDTLKKHSLHLCDENGSARGKSYSIFKSLIFDTQIDGDDAVYHLSEGGWYRFDAEFTARISSFLDPLFVDQILPDYYGGGEGHYNETSANLPFQVCLDRKNISPSGQRQVEPCDIAELSENDLTLIHVKRSTQSASLSHLFNQGINSLDLLRSVSESAAKLEELIAEEVHDNMDDWSKQISSQNYAIRFAIITHKNPERKSVNLPLFSRISLHRIMMDLQTRNVKASIEFVMDQA